ncbi:MAG: hypothetical protein ACUVQQ_01460 [Thermogutta sp.]
MGLFFQERDLERRLQKGELEFDTAAVIDGRAVSRRGRPAVEQTVSVFYPKSKVSAKKVRI